MTQRAVRPAVDFLLRLLVPIETEIAELQFSVDWILPIALGRLPA